LQIAVPAGTAHDAYTDGNNGGELLQTIGNVDFQVEAKFDSTPTSGSQGIMAMQDLSAYVRCDVVSNNDGPNVYSAYLRGTSADDEIYTGIGTSSSYWLRLSRAGDAWTCSVSGDGIQFTTSLTAPVGIRSYGLSGMRSAMPATQSRPVICRSQFRAERLMMPAPRETTA
jgi:regulation of enolase protein 1 (concanavalin A-like superfamily)